MSAAGKELAVRQPACQRKSFHRDRLAVVAAFALGLIVVPGLAVGPAPASGADKPDRGGTIIWAVHETMPDFDMMYTTSYILHQPVGPIYNGLVTPDVYGSGAVIGDLAERWEVAEDGKQITFTLHKNVKFHDGSEFTCADAAYSVERLADRKRAAAAIVGVLDPVFAGAKCTSKHTLVLSLKRPSASIMNMLSASHAVMMKQGISERVDRKDVKFLVGTGPFKFKSYTPGVDFQAERNPNYWKPGIPNIDGYRAVVMSDLTKIFASFRARQITMTGIGRHLEQPEAKILKKDFPDGVVGIGPRSTWDNFVMNIAKPPFNDPRVRKAVALATDREKMIEIAVEGWGALGGFIGPHLPYGLALEELKTFPQFGPDMDKRRAEARRLMAEAGYASGVTIEHVSRRGPLYERGALSRQDDLKKVGITMKINLVDTAVTRDRELKGDFHAVTSPASVYVDDPDLYYQRLVCNNPQNYGRYCNPEFDKLYDQQSRTFDVKKRAEITRKMERILLADVPDDRGYYWMATFGYWNRVQRMPVIAGAGVYNFGKFEQVWCKGGKCM
jgi:peptide/nickel transport system substrate-binding protein